MIYKGYRARIDYEDEDNIFVGRVIGLRDSITFQGRSTGELEKHFREAVNSYLESCRKWGKTPDREYTGRFNLRIPSGLHRKLAHEAEKRNMSINELMLKMLQGNRAA